LVSRASPVLFYLNTFPGRKGTGAMEKTLQPVKTTNARGPSVEPRRRQDVLDGLSSAVAVAGGNKTKNDSVSRMIEADIDWLFQSDLQTNIAEVIPVKPSDAPEGPGAIHDGMEVDLADSDSKGGGGESRRETRKPRGEDHG
jgi:hypothetical protein